VQAKMLNFQALFCLGLPRTHPYACPSCHSCRLIEEEVSRAAVPFKRFAAAAERSGAANLVKDTRVRLPVYVVRRGATSDDGSMSGRPGGAADASNLPVALRDELDLAIGALGGCGQSLAGAVQAYAAGVCSDLRLGPGWFAAIVRHVGMMISDVNEVRRSLNGGGSMMVL
jgi:hypothetical protein